MAMDKQASFKFASVHTGCHNELDSPALDDYLDLLADYNHEYDLTDAIETTERLFSSNMHVVRGNYPIQEALDSVLKIHRNLRENLIESSSHVPMKPHGHTNTVQSKLLSENLKRLQRSVMLDHSYCRPVRTSPISKCSSSPLAEDCSSVQTDEKKGNVKIPESKPTLKEVNANVDLNRLAFLATKPVPRRYLVKKL